MGAGCVVPLQREPTLFEVREPGAHPRFGEGGGRGERGRGRDAGDLELTAEDRRDRVFVAVERALGVGGTFGRAPQRLVPALDDDRSSSRRQLSELSLPIWAGAGDDQ